MAIVSLSFYVIPKIETKSKKITPLLFQTNSKYP